MVLEGHPWERGVRRGVMVLEKGGLELRVGMIRCIFRVENWRERVIVRLVLNGYRVISICSRFLRLGASSVRKLWYAVYWKR